MKLASILAVAVPSLIVGTGLAWSLRSPSEANDEAVSPTAPESEPESPASRVELTTESPSPRDVARESEAETPPRTPLVDADEVAREDNDVLFSEALLDHARRELVKGWHRERRDDPTEAEVGEGIDKFKEAALSLPHSIGIQLAKRRSDEELALEDARTGGVMMTLKRLEDGGEGPLMGLVRDRATFDQFFVAEHSSAAIEGSAALSQEALNKREPVKDGSTLTFSAGVFELKDFGSYWRDHFPRDLTLRGAGKSSTLLVLKQDLSAYDTVRNLTFENFTIHADDNYLFDIRQPSMSLTLRNVRVTGWDMGAGGSCLFGTKGLALRATNSEFLSGYGRAPPHSRLFDVRSNALLARFENCTIARTEVFRGTMDGATLVFSACRIEDAMDRNGEVPDHALLDGTSITWMESTLRRQPPKLDLNDLFPGWKEALAR